MFKRYGLFVAALGLAVLVNPAWPQNTENQIGAEERASEADSGGTKQDKQAFEILPALNGIESAIRDLITEENEAETSRRKDQESRDLQAQEDMAVWAGMMFWASFASIMLTAAGLYLIGRTLRYTQVAAAHGTNADRG